MILSRVIEHVKHQNWTAVALDFVIVVMGVFIGIQLGNWNNVRHERALERQYLQRIYDDLQKTFASQQERHDWDETLLRQQSLILKDLRAGVLPEKDREDFETGLALFGFVGGVDVEWGTVDELQSTGAMNIIRDVPLRSMILSADASLKKMDAISDNFYGSIYAFREAIGDRFGVTQFQDARRGVRLDYDFSALASDPGFINRLSQIDYLSQFNHQLGGQRREVLDNLSDALAARLYPNGKETP